MKRVFDFNFEGCIIKTLMIGEQPWFIETNIVDLLGYKNGNQDLYCPIDNEDKDIVVISDYRGEVNVTVLNEYAVYILLKHCHLSKEKAYEIKQWLSKEVIPKTWKSCNFISPKVLEWEQGNVDITEILGYSLDIANRMASICELLIRAQNRTEDSGEILSDLTQSLIDAFEKCENLLENSRN